MTNISPRNASTSRIKGACDLQAAIGLAQFQRIDSTIQRKLDIRQLYYDRLRNCPGVKLPVDNGFGKVVPFRTNILVDNPGGLSEFLAEREVATRRFFYPLHLQPSLNSENSTFRFQPKTSVRLFETGLMLPSGLNLTEEQIQFVCAGIEEYQSGRADQGFAHNTPPLAERVM